MLRRCSAGDDWLVELMFLELLERGYYMARRGFIALNLEIGDEHLDGFVSAVGEILDRHGDIMAAG